MAGRGGFKGPSTSLRPEQLQGMGIMGKDMPSSTVAPPPTFPPLLSRPAILEINENRDFMISWREHFLSYLKQSPYYTGSSEDTKKMHTNYYLESAQMEQSAFNWSYMPAELKPNWKRKSNAKDGSSKVRKVVDIEETLKALEQKEKNRKGDGEAPIKDEDKESDGEDVEDEQQDDEMDEDNDYGMNYFDNGENYNDEDDNLDDGPTY